MTSDAHRCRFLDWDSAFFGARIASVGDRPLSRDDMERAIEWCRAQSIDCAYLLVEASDVATERLCAEHEFRMVDIRMTYEVGIERPRDEPVESGLDRPAREERTGSKLAPAAREEHAGSKSAPAAREEHAELVRPSREADIPALRAIAAVNHTDSRFYADGRFDRARCDELYATWIEKSCRGWADVVLVAEHERAPAGYVSCHVREGGLGEIGLVGIAENARGRGFARALVSAALGWFTERGIRRASVVTQGRNVPAQRLYQSAGFRASRVQVWHHRWFTPSGSQRP